MFLTGPYKAVSIIIPALLVAGSPGTQPGPEEYAKASSAAPMLAQAQAVTPAPGTAGPSPTTTRDLFVTVGKSLIVDSPVNIQRVSVANADLAEAVAVNPREVLVNGKAPGETSLIVWQQGGNRLFFDLTVRRSNTRIDLIQQELPQIRRPVL